MKKTPRSHRIAIGLLIAFLGGLAVYIWMVGRLARDRRRIEKELAQTLALIETTASDPLMDSKYQKLDLDELLARIEKKNVLSKQLATALASPYVYWADWSDDGHHGAECIDSHEGRQGCETFPWIASRSWDGRRALYHGRSIEGDKLLVFEGYVPKGFKKVYSIAFYEKSFHESACLEIKKDAQQDIAPNDR